MLTREAVTQEPRNSMAITQRWLHDMIDAGWMFSPNDDYIFMHADEHVKIARNDAPALQHLFWKKGVIPTPYNVDRLIGEGHNRRLELLGLEVA